MFEEETNDVLIKKKSTKIYELSLLTLSLLKHEYLTKRQNPSLCVDCLPLPNYPSLYEIITRPIGQSFSL